MDDLLQQAENVLKQNDRGGWTVPAADLYPHQWLWDSCFIAIGLAHVDVERAQTELKHLLRGQWSNGMLPNIIFADGPEYRRDREVWRSYISPYSPDDVATSGLTQPPMLAEAVYHVGKKLPKVKRRRWYADMLPYIVHYHQWLYQERDPHQEGLVLLLHPYESGLDNTPYWVSELRKHSLPWWVRLIEKAHVDGVVNKVRRDTQHIPPGQRMSNVEAMAYWAALHRLRRKAYNTEAILSRSLFAVEDLAFNCMLIRANSLLKDIAKVAGRDLPAELLTAMDRTESALEQLWDDTTGQYYSRSFVSHKLVEEPTIAGLLPLYAGNITPERAKRLVELLHSRNWFDAKWPVPSVPLKSEYFDPFKYWQGPSWVNINWLIMDGLERGGFKAEADALRQKTIDMVAQGGFYEYFNPKTGEPAGAPNFSWTAALTIDLLNK
jgi:neutral trehalase